MLVYEELTLSLFYSRYLNFAKQFVVYNLFLQFLRFHTRALVTMQLFQKNFSCEMAENKIRESPMNQRDIWCVLLNFALGAVCYNLAICRIRLMAMGKDTSTKSYQAPAQNLVD